MGDCYIHGFSLEEQRRLHRQADVLAPNVFHGLDFSEVDRLLELGCGVGAELRLLSERWPGLHLTGVDRSEVHLAAARDSLRGRDIDLVQADATDLPFPDASFDRVITIWMLEHVADPAVVMKEALRVVKPDGLAIFTEVDNATFRFDPRVDAIADWWEHFSRWQQSAGGDPSVGPKLEAIARDLGCRDVRAEEFPNVSSRHEPGRRQILLKYLEELLLSGTDALRESGAVDDVEERNLRAAFAEVARDPSIEFQYLAVRMTCRPIP